MSDSPAARRSPSRGFTLIEVLVTLVILSTGIVLVLAAFQTVAAALESSRDVLAVSRLVRDAVTQTVSDAEGLEGRVAPSAGSSDANGLSLLWRVDVREIATLPRTGEEAGHPIVLNEVTVTAFREGGVERQVVTRVLSGVPGRKAEVR